MDRGAVLRRRVAPRALPARWTGALSRSIRRAGGRSRRWAFGGRSVAGGDVGNRPVATRERLSDANQRFVLAALWPADPDVAAHDNHRTPDAPSRGPPSLGAPGAAGARPPLPRRARDRRGGRTRAPLRRGRLRARLR